MRSMVDDDGRQGDSAEVGQGVLVVASGNAAPVLEAVEAAFDGVALPVGGDVETGWSPATWSLGLASLNLVAALGNSVWDLRPAQPGTRRVVRVRLVTQQPEACGVAPAVPGEQPRQHPGFVGLFRG